MRAAVSVLGLAARNQAFIGDTLWELGFIQLGIRNWRGLLGITCLFLTLLATWGTWLLQGTFARRVPPFFCKASAPSLNNSPQWAGDFPAPSGRAYCVCLGLWVVLAKRLEGVYSFSALSCSLTACTFSAICASSSLRRSTFLANSPRRLLPDLDLALRKVRLVS